MQREFLENKSWTEIQWKHAPLGGRRRNNRAIKIAEHMLVNTAASLPAQMKEWSTLKGAYRFFKSKTNTHETLQQEHWNDVNKEASRSTKTILFIQDKSMLDFSATTKTTGLGHIGNHSGKGINFQSILAVEYDNEPTAILGLSYQKAWIRTEQSYQKKEKRSERVKRQTEADYWIESLKKIERPSTSNAQWVTIGDRENDNFKVIRYCNNSGWDFLIRANNGRNILTESSNKIRLDAWARSLPAQANKKILLRARPQKPARTAHLSIAWNSVFIVTPKNRFRRSEHETIKVWCIRVWEEGSDLEWFLITNCVVESKESALEKVGWYEARWLIEEYHKCLKTGCALEKSQLKSAQGLLSLLGFLGVIATRVLAIKFLAKEKPSEKAILHYPYLHLQILVSQFPQPLEEITCHQYWYYIARLGGFIGRKSDGDPGWQTLWKGWLRFLDLIEAVELWKKCG